MVGQKQTKYVCYYMQHLRSKFYSKKKDVFDCIFKSVVRVFVIHFFVSVSLTEKKAKKRLLYIQQKSVTKVTIFSSSSKVTMPTNNEAGNITRFLRSSKTTSPPKGLRVHLK